MNEAQSTHGTESESDSRDFDGFIKPPFGYFGAKQRLASRIIEMFPPHNAWVEVFCGSSVVTLNKEPSPIEIINDLDGDIVNFFTVLRSHSDELIRAVALTPYAFDEFRLSRLDRNALEPLERARRFLVATMMTVNGTAGSVNSGFSRSDSYTRGGREARVNRWYSLPARLERVVERLRSVRVESADARTMVRKFAQRPATLLYLDPPYLMDRSHTYATDANDAEFHRELLEECINANCMIIISGYKHPVYSEYLKRANGWVSTRLETTTRGVHGIDEQRTEMLWTNKHFRDAKKSSVVPIEFSKAESKEKKVNPQRGNVAAVRFPPKKAR